MRLIQARFAFPLVLALVLQGLAPLGQAWAQSPPAQGAPASAGQPKAEDEATKARVKAAYDRGVEASNAQDWPKAIEALGEAWSLKQHYQIAANLGRAEFMAGKHWDAAGHLRFFLREAPPTVSAEEKKKAQEMFEKALTRVGSVTIQVNVPGAEVLVDGKPVGRAPLAEPVFVEPGTRAIEARHPGYNPARESADVAQGTAPTIRLQLVKAGASDGSQKSPEPTGGGKPNKTIIIAGAAVAGVAAVVGAVSGGLALKYAGDRRDKTSDKCSGDNCVGDFFDAEDKRVASARVSLGSFIGAGVVGALVVGYVLWPRPQPSSPQASAKLVLGPQGARAVVTVPW